MLRPSTAATGGYPRVQIGSKSHAVHVMVCEAFHGPRPPGMQAAHLDGKSSNPRRDNLAWATPEENAAHKRLHGTARLGERHPGAKLTDADVVQLRRRWRAGESWRALGKAFGVSSSGARDAGIGVTFANVPNPCPKSGEPGHRPSGAARVLATTHEQRAAAGKAGALKQHASAVHPMAKITAADAAEIRRRLLAGDRQADLARTYGLSRSTVCGIASGRLWAKARGMTDAPC